MRIGLGIFALAYTFLCQPAAAQSATSEVHCGTSRWDVKTLGDPAAKSLPAKAVPTTIEDLIQLRPPANPDRVPDRVSPAETTLWSVRGRLLAYWIESDSDYHLLLAGLQSGRTLYAEIPSPDCAASHQRVYARLRAAVDALGKHPASDEVWWLNLNSNAPPVVSITGYGFFDHVRGFPDVGEAPNGIEIHPVLQFTPNPH